MGSKQCKESTLKCTQTKFLSCLATMELARHQLLVCFQVFLVLPKEKPNFSGQICFPTWKRRDKLWEFVPSTMSYLNYWQQKSTCHSSMILKVPTQSLRSKKSKSWWKMLELTINEMLWLTNFQVETSESCQLRSLFAAALSLCCSMNQRAEWIYLREDSFGTCLKSTKKIG